LKPISLVVVSRRNFNTQESLEYYLHYKYTNWITTLALEVPAANIQLPTSEQLHTRYQAANNVNRLDKEYGKNNTYNTAFKSNKEKLEKKNAMITEVDKGNYLVIINGRCAIKNSGLR